MTTVFVLIGVGTCVTGFMRLIEALDAPGNRRRKT